MSNGIGNRIDDEAKKIIEDNHNGIRYGELFRKVKENLPKANPKTISGRIWNLHERFPDEIYKPARGIYRLIRFKESEEEGISEEGIVEEEINERDFYEPFADYLVNELEECTKAIPLGGNIFGQRWGTPDVIGIRETKRCSIYKPPIEITSVEIKLDKNRLKEAFGQACSYKLFSHKSYVVIPSDSRPEDIGILDSLCLILGIGLVLFNKNNVDDPAFDVRVRPQKHEPDIFYVNKYLAIIENKLF